MYYAAAFAIFCIVCTVLAFKRHPIWGLYFYLATTFVYPPARWWGYLFANFRLALLSAAVTALAVLLHRGKLRDKPVWIGQAPVVLLGLYLAWMGIQTLWALDFADHIDGTTQFFKCMLALWFVYRVIDSKERLRDLMLALVMGCALLGIYAMMTGRQDGRLDGVGGPNLDDANTLGMYLVASAMLGVGLVLTQKGWRRWTALACLILIVEGFVLANSRGAFLGLVAGGLVVAFGIAKRHRPLFWAFALVGVVGLAVLVDKVFVERMFTISDVTSEDENADMSARSRLAVAKAQLQMFLDHPMGSGFRGTAALSTQYLDEKWMTYGNDDMPSRSSHNTFLTALTEQGIVGALIYGTLVGWVMSAILRVRRMNGPNDDPELTSLGAALCGSLAVVLVAGTTADYLIKEIQFWVYAALLSVFWLSSQAHASNVPAAAPRRTAMRHAT